MRLREFTTEGARGLHPANVAPVDLNKWSPGKTAPAGALQAWKGDARTGTIETLPHTFNPANLTKQLSAYKWARDKKLLPVIPPEFWAMLLLVEGREDFGFNPVELVGTPSKAPAPAPTGPSSGIPGEPGYTGKGQNTSPTLEKFIDKVKQAGMTDQANAVWISFLHDKIKTAQRVGIPLYQAWNGGTIYLKRFDAQAKALQDPKNKPFLDWFKQQLA